MISENVDTPRTSGRRRRPLTMIQLMLSVSAAPTRRTQRTTKTIEAVWRRVIGQVVGLSGCQAVRIADCPTARRPDGLILRCFFVFQWLADLGDLHVPRQAQRLQYADADPVHVELVPRQSMTGRDRVCVVIVVPAFAEGHH